MEGGNLELSRTGTVSHCSFSPKCDLKASCCPSPGEDSLDRSPGVCRASPRHRALGWERWRPRLQQVSAGRSPGGWRAASVSQKTGQGLGSGWVRDEPGGPVRRDPGACDGERAQDTLKAHPWAFLLPLGLRPPLPGHSGRTHTPALDSDSTSSVCVRGLASYPGLGVSTWEVAQTTALTPRAVVGITGGSSAQLGKWPLLDADWARARPWGQEGTAVGRVPPPA